MLKIIFIILTFANTDKIFYLLRIIFEILIFAIWCTHKKKNRLHNTRTSIFKYLIVRVASMITMIIIFFFSINTILLICFFICVLFYAFIIFLISTHFIIAVKERYIFSDVLLNRNNWLNDRNDVLITSMQIYLL